MAVVSRIAVVPLAVGFFTMFAPSAFLRGEANWPQFRGPNAAGIISAPEIPTQWTADNYLWRIELPGLGHSSPVYWEGRLYVTSETKGEKSRQVLCLEAQDGKQVWSHREAYREAVGHHKLNSFAASTPAVDEHGIYVSWISGDDFLLLALDHDGKQLWRHEIPCGFATQFGPGASPIVLDRMVIMSNQHEGEECFLIGVDAKSGRIAWQVPRTSGMASYCTPKVYRPEAGPVQVLFSSMPHGLTSIDPKTGKIYWEMPCGFTLRTCASPVIADGVVFVTSGKGPAGVETAAIALPDVTKGEPPRILYRSAARLPYVPTPLAFDGKFLLWTDAGFITCIEAKTGNKLWEGKLGDKFFASPLLIDGRVFNTSLSGRLTVLAADRFEILAEHKLPEGTHATPAVAGGRMYVRTYENLICVGQ